jgi:hypothetical protein
MSFFPTSDIFRWSQIAAQNVDEQIEKRIVSMIETALRDANSYALMLANEQLKSDRIFCDTLTGALKRLYADGAIDIGGPNNG